MAEHIREGKPDANGDVPLEIWYDDPKEAPNYGERGQAIGLDPEQNYRRTVLEDLGPSSAAHFDANAHRYIDRLHHLAAQALPPETVYEIRSSSATDYGRRRGIAWYTIDAMQSWPLVPAIPYPGRGSELGGYFFHGRFKTPRVKPNG